MLDPQQLDKYSDQDLALVKAMFGGDSTKLYALRNHLWQFGGEKPEFNPEELALLKKILLPINSPEVPMGWITNMYQSLTRIKEFAPQGAIVHIKANDILVNYIKQQFLELVSGEEHRKIVLEDLPVEKGGMEEDRYIDMLAYHQICSYIEGRMAEFKSKANPPKEPTEEEIEAKQKKNDTR